MTLLNNLDQLPSDHYDFAMSMVPTDKHVNDLYFGQTRLAEKLNKDCFLVDSSTISPLAALDLHTKLKTDFGMDFIDAPVAGGVPGAQNANLTFMIGSETSELFEVSQSRIR